MNKIKVIFSLGLITGLCFSAMAQDQYKKLENIAEFKQKLDKMANSTESIEADFTQEKYMDILSNTMQSGGKILFKKPNLLKWAYQEPFQYVIVLDGKEIKIKDEEKTNTFDIASSKVFKQVNDLIVSSVNGKILQDDKFDISYFQDDKNYIALMEPKEGQMKKFVNKIDLFFDKSNLTVNKIVMHEPNADYTIIHFLNKKINSGISDEAFKVD